MSRRAMMKQVPAKTQPDLLFILFFFLPAVMQTPGSQVSWDVKCKGICINYSHPSRRLWSTFLAKLLHMISRNPGYQKSRVATGSKDQHRQLLVLRDTLSSCLVTTSFNPSNFPCRWVFSQLFKMSPFQMEREQAHSNKPFILSSLASTVSQSSSFPWKVQLPLQLSSLAGSALTHMEAPQYPKFTTYLQDLQDCIV